MSNINYSAIETNYPISGKDNNSQGFRDNFSAISNALATAKTEISALQTNSVLVADLTSGTSTVENNLQGSSIINGTYNRMYGLSLTSSVIDTTDIDLDNGSLQVFTLTGDTTFTFTSWPEDSIYAKVRVHIKSDGLDEWTATFDSENGGDIVASTTFPSPLTVSVNGKHKVVEAWSYDNGLKVYLNYIGEF